MSSVQSSTHTLEFSLRAEETVVNDTVKVVAEISALLTGGDENLQTSIREMMTKLIPTATWNFSNMVRSLHDTGYEQVTLTATARVSESENYNLENRAKQVSKTGLSITNINVDTSIPLKMLEEVERKLRKTIFKEAREEANELGYEVSRIVFNTMPNASYLSNQMVASTSNIMMQKASYGSGFDEDNVLGNAAKITLTASVVLSYRHVH